MSGYIERRLRGIQNRGRRRTSSVRLTFVALLDVAFAHAAGAIIYSNGTDLKAVAPGTAGKILTAQGTKPPTWEDKEDAGFDCYNSAGLTLTAGSWTPLTWDSATAETGLTHNPSAAGTEIIELDAANKIELEYSVSVYDTAGAGTNFQARIMRSTGGGAYAEVAGTRSACSTPGSGALEYACMLQVKMLLSQSAGDRYRVEVSTSGAVNKTMVADGGSFRGRIKP